MKKTYVIWRFLFGLLLIATATVFSPSTADAQTRDEFQLWSSLSTTAKVSDSPMIPKLWFDGHARRGSAGTVTIIRPGLGFELADWLTLWAGYAWVPVSIDGGGVLDEHRIWQQMTISNKFDSGLSFQLRTRFEQRFHEAGDDVGFRLRQFARVNYKPKKNLGVGVALWDEIFIGLNDTDWGASGGFDQNRLFVGPFFNIGEMARVEAGYLFVYLNREPSNQIAHTLAVNFFVSMK